jgi:hypothetical protein
LLSEKSFGCLCAIEVRAMNTLKETSTFIHDDWVIDAMHRANEKHTFFKTSAVDAVTPAIFNAARYIEVSIYPVDSDKAPASAWAHLEFKGLLAQQATFYLQPDDAEPLQAMKAAHGWSVFGDGYDANSHRGIGVMGRLGPFCITN